MLIENTRKSNPFTIFSEMSNQTYSLFLTQRKTLRIIETSADSGGAEIRRQPSGGRASQHNSRIPTPTPPQRDDYAAQLERRQQTTIHVDF
jgi:hypothetical protein